jgi:hypothetical protein
MIKITVELVTKSKNKQDQENISCVTTSDGGIDSSVSEVLEIFYQSMLGLGYQPISLAECFEDKAEELKQAFK